MALTDYTNIPRPRRKELSDAKKNIIVGMKRAGKTNTYIAKDLGIPRSTVIFVCKKYEATGSTTNVKRSGRPPKLTPRDVRTLVLSVRKDPMAPYHVHQENLARTGTTVCRDTVIKYLKLEGFSSCAPALKPKLTSHHIQRRLSWTRLYKNWTNNDWANVIWSDESRFSIVGNDGGARVLRRIGERYQERHVVTTVKFGKGSVMVWGCFWAGGLGPLVVMEGSVDQDAYVNCLAKHFIPYLRKMEEETGREFIFQEDGASCHTGSYTTWFKRQCQIKSFPYWPAQSPDLNPIENLWNALDRRLQKRRGFIRNIAQLKACLQEEWGKMSLDLAKRLVDSMPDRCKAVRKARGKHTKY